MNTTDPIPSAARRAASSPVTRGFTIAEIIVAVVITAFVAAATSIALTQAAKARDASSAKVEARVRAEAAASRIAGDVENAVRDAEVFYTRLKLTDRSVSGWARDELIVYSRSLKLARSRTDQGEGGEYEVQYRLDNSGNAGAMAAANQGKGVASPLPRLALWRRMDPVPDDVPDGGGVATAIVDGIVSLDIRAYDGSAWSATWESDDLGYPHAVSVTVSATDDSGKYEAVCRRIVALDRTPLPVTPVVVDESTPTTPAQNP